MKMRIRKIALALIASSLVSPLFSQSNIEQILAGIEANNTTLKAFKEQTEAEKISHHVGINMENPEVEYGRLWGDSNAEGDKYDISISQSFDFPTVYHHKKKLAKHLDSQADLVYQEQCLEILFEARKLCIELVYQSTINTHLTERLSDAQKLYDAYEKAYNAGNIDVLERNRAKISLVNSEKALQLNEIVLTGLRSELQRMNGGTPLNFDPSEYEKKDLPLNFEEWIATVLNNMPTLKLREYQIEASRKQEQVTEALNLPKITAGYLNAKEGRGRFNGFTVGVSIPLWENKNMVKHQKAQTNAFAMQYEDSKQQLFNTLRTEYNKAVKMKSLLGEYQEILKNTNDKYLLSRALEQGSISLITYLQELTVYYETVDQYLETEWDYNRSLAELYRWQ